MLKDPLLPLNYAATVYDVYYIRSVMAPQAKMLPKATPEASLDSSMEHLIEQDNHLYTKDEVSSNRNLSSLKSTLTFEDSLNVATKMMVKSFEELNTPNTSSTPSDSSADHRRQELVLSAVNLQPK